MAATSHVSILVLLFLSLTSLSFSESCHPDDEKALLQIKKDLNNPYTLISWKPEIDCCYWNSVECYEKTYRIIDLDLSYVNANLPIPASIGDLPYLESLSFHKGNVTGEIPLAISKLSELTFLDLTWNQLTGPVPDFFSLLKKVTYIGLSFNSLTGSIPASLSQLSNLEGLFLDRNKLTGSIPESFGDFKQPDLTIDLSHNQLSGPIPRKLGYANFFMIDVSRNMLEGDISFMFGKTKELNSADFSRNLFQFDFSNVEFSNALVNLDLSHNMMYGSLPKGLVEADLISLNVSYNMLCGQIPVGGGLRQMDYTAYFHNKCLCGSPLPECK